MSIKVDIPKSEQSRADGNISFKKGKWAEAIGHYTNAVINNPQDPVAYCNRAQAYLKLDKFQDAERDCSSALDLPKGKGNIKALYRRGLARKGLQRNAEAIEDLEAILKLDRKNEAVKTELEELRVLKRKQDEELRKPPRRPLTPPSLTKPTLSSQPIADLTSQTQKLDIAPKPAPARESLEPTGPKKENSFAAIRKNRDGKKMSFASSSNGSGPGTNGTVQEKEGGDRDKKEEAIQSALHHIFPPSKPNSSPAAQQGAPKGPLVQPAETKTVPALPKNIDTTSTSPGAGLVLLRHFTPSPAFNYSLISLYPPPNIPVILGSLLEPDTLGQVLLALEEGVQSENGEDKERVKMVLEGLKATKRWGMNVAMLSRREKDAGEGAWRGCGGEGKWA
ncbi:hypothetical protein B9479_000488 [Cryptococcus floricola]|uniref:RNA-polymerase II-associated protein 3-like C-terminal domain-containing protein n=1 Tax=Cryptococcus floricola TaxID=2591691 RepID=A0A5D3B6T5_9TREE|nr:hypothetical protein B9479_000488 [Cryptococcus floricola]